jgi:hypothetical protein
MPDRRKPGGTRSEIAMPGRRKPGGTRSEIAMPGRRRPGSARPLYGCQPEEAQLTALVPQNLKGLTSKPDPRLFFYLPALPPTKEIELVVRNHSDRLVFEKSFRGSERAGIIEIALPPTFALTSSEDTKEYHWYLSIICNPGDRAYDVVVEGLIERVDLPAESLAKLGRLDLAQRITFYRSYQLWHDALTALADSKISGESTAESTVLLQQLLQAANIDPQLAREPIFSLPNAHP